MEPSTYAVKRDYLYAASILLSSVIIAGTWIYVATGSQRQASVVSLQNKPSELQEEVIPSKGVVLPVKWGDLGKQLVADGVIDAPKLEAIYSKRGPVPQEYNNLLLGDANGNLTITSANSGYILNLLWALGLANKNPILEKGEMTDPQYGGAGNFASTGGWTVAKGSAMSHYSKYLLLSLTPAQQALVDKVSRGIYRPCCGNSTHFPDCNHGMAMLGLLELMASQGVSEKDMWKTALEVNSFWFPDNYLTIAQYEKNKGISWEQVNPQEVLGAQYSSSQGFARIAAQVAPRQQSSGGGGCGVDNGGSVPVQQTSQPGCGI